MRLIFSKFAQSLTCLRNLSSPARPSPGVDFLARWISYNTDEDLIFYIKKREGQQYPHIIDEAAEAQRVYVICQKARSAGMIDSNQGFLAYG